MASDNTVGIFLHSFFPVPGWGLRDMGVAGWKAQIDWARSLGFNTCSIMLLPQVRADHPDFTLPEQRRLYHGLLTPLPEFIPGNLVWAKDPLMNTEQAHHRANILRQALTHSRQVGLSPRLGIMIGLGSPSFVRGHPELQAVFSGDFCIEGHALCLSQPAAMEHLLEFWADAVDSHPEVDSFFLWTRDPGGCDCRQCRGNIEGLGKTLNRFYEMIRTRRPTAQVLFATWWFNTEEIHALSKVLPKDIRIIVCPLIHSLVRPPEEYTHQVSLWRDSGFEIESWLEVQENPTFLLPACYPRRIEHTLRSAQDLGIRHFTAASALYAHTFTLNFHTVAELARERTATAQKVTKNFFNHAFGSETVPAALEFAESLEKVWTLFYAPSQHKAGFNWPWHIVFEGGLLPPKLLREPPSPELVADIENTVQAAQSAIEAVEKMTKLAWPWHSLDSTVLLISTRLLLLRAKFRQAKLHLLEAVRNGNVKEASEAFKPLVALAQEMTDTAACAPNTQVLNTHWSKLELLPQRLGALQDHLRELVETRQIREIFTYGHRTEPVSGKEKS